MSLVDGDAQTKDAVAVVELGGEKSVGNSLVTADNWATAWLRYFHCLLRA